MGLTHGKLGQNPDSENDEFLGLRVYRLGQIFLPTPRE